MPSLKIGIVGCGHTAKAHLRAWDATRGCELEVACDKDRRLAEDRAREFGIRRATGELADAISRCDVIDVCTPPDSRAAIAGDVLAAGRHLLVEPPLVTRAADWKPLRAKLERSGALLVVLHDLVFSRSIRQAKRWLDDGKIGEILRFERHLLTSPRHARMLSAAHHWANDLAGGRWLDALPDDLYLAHHFAGPQVLDSVTPLARPDDPAGVPAGEVSLTLRNDQTITRVEYSARCRLNRHTTTLIGTEGVIEVDALSDVAALSRSADARWKRIAGHAYLQAAGKLAQVGPDRSGYLFRRARGQSPHTTAIREAAAYFAGRGSSPTPLEEIDDSVESAEVIGRAIDEAAKSQSSGAAAEKRRRWWPNPWG